MRLWKPSDSDTGVEGALKSSMTTGIMPDEAIPSASEASHPLLGLADRFSCLELKEIYLEKLLKREPLSLATAPGLLGLALSHNVPELEEDDSHLPLAQRLERHRNQKGCVKCHEGIDPWGLPFETFDAGGLPKHDEKIDSSSTLPDGTTIKDLNALKDYLARDRIDRVAFSYLKHVACYATGRSLRYNELAFLEENGLKLRKNDYRMQDMIRFVIKSDLFLKK